ncbi:MAG: DNA photolyase [Deltaproteobacteria bacterium]|nr:DNA photolyase [Candidatus Anaeroferrophillus wilburensis]MBN2889869.1 DNA photolyase [Deltaproteobacteria bacterium]
MTKSMFQPTRVLVEQDAFSYPYTEEILQRLPAAEVVTIGHPDQELFHELDFSPAKTLLLMVHRGKFFKPCPGTAENYRCCLYQILHLGLGCSIGCSYCVLQGYLNNPFITQFVNLDDALRELDEVFSSHPDSFFRIGTGEFTDSLFMDPLTRLSAKLVPYFARQTHAVLELKTKSVAVDNLLQLEGEVGETIVSWSLNAPSVVAREELGAPSLKQRLAAAARCRQRGYRIGLHFDPLVFFPGWQQEYRETVRLIFDYLAPDDIIWISLGAFRYLPPMKEAIKEQHPESSIIYQEFVRGLDGKMRYFSGIRRAMYRHLVAEIRQHAPDVFLYFCMEHERLWLDVFGYAPTDNQQLSLWLDRCCHRYPAQK